MKLVPFAWRNSLFIKIYLTLLASLAVVAIASAAFVWIGHDEDDRGWRGRRDQFIAAMLPPEASPAELNALLGRLRSTPISRSTIAVAGWSHSRAIHSRTGFANGAAACMTRTKMTTTIMA